MKTSEKDSLIIRRRQAMKKGASFLALALLPVGASAQLGAPGRVTKAGRDRARKRHSVVAYRRANANQIAEARTEAAKLQAKALKKWTTRTPRGRAYAKENPSVKRISTSRTSPATVAEVKKAPMKVVVNDIKVAPVQGVKVPPGAQGSRTGVMPVDIRTGGVVGNGVVEMAAAPGRGKSVSEQVKAANADGTINGGGVFLTTDVKLASL